MTTTILLPLEPTTDTEITCMVCGGPSDGKRTPPCDYEIAIGTRGGTSWRGLHETCRERAGVYCRESAALEAENARLLERNTLIAEERDTVDAELSHVQTALTNIRARLFATHETNLPRGYTCTCCACIGLPDCGWLVADIDSALALPSSRDRKAGVKE
jgi:hypothetical protein